MKTTKFILYGKPISVNHAYGNRNGGRYLKPAGRAFKDDLGWTALQAMRGSRPLFLQPIHVQINFFFSDKLRRDIDNGIKLCLDALTGIIWKDDSEVTSLIVTKQFDKKARIEFEITQL